VPTGSIDDADSTHSDEYDKVKSVTPANNNFEI